MTRIISGRAGSLTLAVPDAGTRPTSDRVRESLFGALDAADAIRGSVVADLFAGSGALALEAISRGAAAAHLIERAPRAAAVAERNARTVQRAVPDARIRVHRSTADAFLRGVDERFGLVFVDPPYDLDDTQLGETLELLLDRLEPEALIVIERATRSPAPHLPAGLVHDRDRRYGDTTLWWVRRG